MDYKPRIFAEQSCEDRAREYEKASMWRDAAEWWKKASCNDDANACVMIAEAIEKGDAYRQKVLEVAGPEPEIDGDKSDSIKWVSWFSKVQDVYNSFFKVKKIRVVGMVTSEPIGSERMSFIVHTDQGEILQCFGVGKVAVAIRTYLANGKKTAIEGTLTEAGELLINEFVVLSPRKI